MKNILGPFTSGLNAVLGVKPILYRWNAESNLDAENVYAGFSAQNVLGYIPEAVGEKDGRYSLNIIPVLAATVNAVQELVAEVDELRVAVGLPAKTRTPPPADTTRVVSSAKATVVPILRKLAKLTVTDCRSVETALGFGLPCRVGALVPTDEAVYAKLKALDAARCAKANTAAGMSLPCALAAKEIR